MSASAARSPCLAAVVAAVSLLGLAQAAPGPPSRGRTPVLVPIVPHASRARGGWVVEYGCVGDGFVAFRVPGLPAAARVAVVSATGRRLEVVSLGLDWTELVLPDELGPPRELELTPGR